LEQFVISAGHDLQAPLRTTTVFTQLLQRQLRKSTDTVTQHLLNRVIDGAKRMKNLVDDLHDYSALGRDGEDFEEMSLQEALDGATANLQSTMEEHLDKGESAYRRRRACGRLLDGTVETIFFGLLQTGF
jgi:light-regulated signal transduction histidine kinase (bacteriophytochrome)